MTLAGCYKATVNESETITDAQPFCGSVAGIARGAEVAGFGFPVTPHIERS